MLSGIILPGWRGSRAASIRTIYVPDPPEIGIMPSYDFRAPRLFVDAPLVSGARIALDRGQSNYLGNVLRLSQGAPILLFNGRDGEWQARLCGHKRPEALEVEAQTREQDRANDLVYVFAPLKHARLDYMVQKAVEMGASKLQPVLTRFTQVSRVNQERMRANVIEAAEQCGIITLADVAAPLPLSAFLKDRAPGRILVFCDEEAGVADPAATLRQARSLQNSSLQDDSHQAAAAGRGIDVLIGPEGGFAGDERALLLAQSHVLRLTLGPRILRADTAAVAALALVQTLLGDWSPPAEC